MASKAMVPTTINDITRLNPPLNGVKLFDDEYFRLTDPPGKGLNHGCKPTRISGFPNMRGIFILIRAASSDKTLLGFPNFFKNS
jgi:hypothetical protein